MNQMGKGTRLFVLGFFLLSALMWTLIAYDGSSPPPSNGALCNGTGVQRVIRDDSPDSPDLNGVYACNDGTLETWSGNELTQRDTSHAFATWPFLADAALVILIVRVARKRKGLPEAGSKGTNVSAMDRKASRAVRPVDLGPAKYMGGHPDYPKPIANSRLILTATELGLGFVTPKKAVTSLSSVASIEIAGDMVAKSKLGATLAFGVLGGLASKGAKNEVAVVVHLKSGATVYYLLPDSKEGPVAVRMKAGPVLQTAGIPFTDDAGSASAPVAGPDVADQLRKLGGLRDDGLLTDEEFAAQKAKWLDGPQFGPGATRTPPVGADEIEQGTQFDVILTAAGHKKIQVIKEIRGLTRLGLKDAKNLVDNVPGLVLRHAPKDQAEAAKQKLESAGANVEIR